METNAPQKQNTQIHPLTHPSSPVVCSACQMVNLLIAKGANINAFDKKDGRALHWAAFMGKKRLKLYSSRTPHGTLLSRKDGFYAHIDL